MKNAPLFQLPRTELSESSFYSWFPEQTGVVSVRDTISCSPISIWVAFSSYDLLPTCLELSCISEISAITGGLGVSFASSTDSVTFSSAKIISCSSLIFLCRSNSASYSLDFFTSSSFLSCSSFAASSAARFPYSYFAASSAAICSAARFSYSYFAASSVAICSAFRFSSLSFAACSAASSSAFRFASSF